MNELLAKIYEDLNELIIKKIPHDKELLSTRIIKEHTKICEYTSNIINSNKDMNYMLEFKVSVKYILFVLMYLVNKNLVKEKSYKILEKEYKDLYYIINP